MNTLSQRSPVAYLDDVGGLEQLPEAALVHEVPFHHHVEDVDLPSDEADLQEGHRAGGTQVHPLPVEGNRLPRRQDAAHQLPRLPHRHHHARVPDETPGHAALAARAAVGGRARVGDAVALAVVGQGLPQEGIDPRL